MTTRKQFDRPQTQRSCAGSPAAGQVVDWPRRTTETTHRQKRRRELSRDVGRTSEMLLQTGSWCWRAQAAKTPAEWRVRAAIRTILVHVTGWCCFPPVLVFSQRIAPCAPSCVHWQQETLQLFCAAQPPPARRAAGRRHVTPVTAPAQGPGVMPVTVTVTRIA